MNTIELHVDWLDKPDCALFTGTLSPMSMQRYRSVNQNDTQSLPVVFNGFHPTSGLHCSRVVSLCWWLLPQRYDALHRGTPGLLPQEVVFIIELFHRPTISSDKEGRPTCPTFLYRQCVGAAASPLWGAKLFVETPLRWSKIIFHGLTQLISHPRFFSSATGTAAEVLDLR